MDSTTMTTPDRWQRDVALSRLTTWRIGGPARFLSLPTSAADLRADLVEARRAELPVFALGGGSNLLFPDAGYPGLLVRLPQSAGALHADGDRATAAFVAGAGASLAALATQFSRAGWRGLEWAAGLPGTLGGAIVDNAGAYGGSMADVVESVRVMTEDGAIETRPAARLGFAHRASALKGPEPTRAFLLSAQLRLTAADPDETMARLAEDLRRRAASLPSEPSCGCVFRNPPGAVAGRLIEQAGLAGRRVGDAQISPRHANFIVNLGRARARDVWELIGAAREAVRERTGLVLELEVQPVGFGPPPYAIPPSA
jgi:UDP-N-acetylmuramate dehydrogenase